MDRRFRLVDVFGERPLTGNPLAVIIDSEGLSTEEMLELTRWLDFSETTFLSSPSTLAADYEVRIFTLAGELPFAGHPTLGSCHVWQSLADESRDEIVQECGAGLVRLRRTGQRIAFEAPALIRTGPVDPEELEELADVLGIDVVEIRAARWVDNGPGWVGLLLEDADAVLALEPDFSRGRRARTTTSESSECTGKGGSGSTRCVPSSQGAMGRCWRIRSPGASTLRSRSG